MPPRRSSRTSGTIPAAHRCTGQQRRGWKALRRGFSRPARTPLASTRMASERPRSVDEGVLAFQYLSRGWRPNRPAPQGQRGVSVKPNPRMALWRLRRGGKGVVDFFFNGEVEHAATNPPLDWRGSASSGLAKCAGSLPTTRTCLCAHSRPPWAVAEPSTLNE